MSVRFTRTGTLVQHGEDLYGRADAVEFLGRSGEPAADWAAEVAVRVSGWATRAGVATLYEFENGGWVALGSAMPFNGIYVKAGTLVRVVFSSYIPLRPGRRYRVVLPGALVVSSAIEIVARSLKVAPALQTVPGV